MPLFACLPQNDFRVAHLYASPEYPALVDSRQLFRAAELYSQGPIGRAELIREAGSRDPQQSAAAKLAMVNSGDRAFLPLLLKPIHGYDQNYDVFAVRAVALYPRECWPILTQMARAGSAGATWAISQYIELGPPELQALWRTRNPRIQANVLSCSSQNTALATGALDSKFPIVVRAAVQALRFNRPTEPSIYLTDHRVLVREAAAELADRWSDASPRMMALWITLSRDRSPVVRRFALLHLGPIGLSWANGPWRSRAIQIVDEAMGSQDPSIRHSAVLAARCWMVEWQNIHKLWDPETIARAEQVFRNSVFRDAAYWEIERNFGPNAYDSMGLQIAGPYTALAIAHDPRTISLFRSKALDKPIDHLEWIESLQYFPSPQSQRLLIEVIRRALLSATVRHAAPDDEDASPAAVTSLIRQGADLRPILALLRSTAYSADAKYCVAVSIARANGAGFTPDLCRFAQDRSWRRESRMNLMYSMVENKDPRVGAMLADVAATDPDKFVRKVATDALKSWQSPPTSAAN